MKTFVLCTLFFVLCALKIHIFSPGQGQSTKHKVQRTKVILPPSSFVFPPAHHGEWLHVTQNRRHVTDCLPSPGSALKLSFPYPPDTDKGESSWRSTQRRPLVGPVLWR